MDHVRCTLHAWKDVILKTFSLLVSIRKLSLRHGGNLRWSRWGERRGGWKGKKTRRKDVEADFSLPDSNISKEKDLLCLCPTACNIFQFCISLKLKHLWTPNLKENLLLCPCSQILDTGGHGFPKEAYSHVYRLYRKIFTETANLNLSFIQQIRR